MNWFLIEKAIGAWADLPLPGQKKAEVSYRFRVSLAISVVIAAALAWLIPN